MEKTKLIQKRFAQLLAGVLGLAAVVQPATASNISLKTGDASGTTSFTGSTNWSNGAVPSSGNDYFTGAFGMRTPPDAVSYTFGGNSLTLANPTTTGFSLIDKASGAATYTINNFTNAGGIIRSGGGRTLKLTITGNVFAITANSALWADQNGWIINSPMVGTGDVTNRTDGNANDTIAYGGVNTGWTGRLRLASTAGTAVLILNNANAVPGNPAAFTANQIELSGTTGATLIDNAGIFVTNVNGGVTLLSATLLTNAPGVTTKITEPIAGTAALTIAGSGTVTLGGSNSFSGGLNLLAATQLNVNGPAALGTGTFNLNSANGVLDNTSGATVIITNNPAISLSQSFTYVGSADLNLGAGIVNNGVLSKTITVNAGKLTFGGAVTNAGAIQKSGAGTLVLAGANTYTGNTTINAGTLSLGTAGSLASTNIIVGSGSVLDVAGPGLTLNGNRVLSGYGNINGNLAAAASSVAIFPGAANGTVGTLTFNNNLDL